MSRRPTLLAVLVIGGFLAGCGSTSPKPTPTAFAGYTDPTSHVTARIDRALPGRDHALLLVSMHNGSSKLFSQTSPPQFIDEALAEPNSSGKVGSCDADTSQGAGLDYQSIPPGATRTGWLRCDYPTTSHIFALFWRGHELGGYRTPNS